MEVRSIVNFKKELSDYLYTEFNNIFPVEVLQNLYMEVEIYRNNDIEWSLSYQDPNKEEIWFFSKIRPEEAAAETFVRFVEKVRVGYAKYRDMDALFRFLYREGF